MRWYLSCLYILTVPGTYICVHVWSWPEDSNEAAVGSFGRGPNTPFGVSETELLFYAGSLPTA